MAFRRNRIGSKQPSCKCFKCKKVVKDDGISGIGCNSCGNWFHGPCVFLSAEEVKRLGSRPNCMRNCDKCVEDGDTPKTEAKLTSLVSKINDTVLKSLSELVPKVIKEVLPPAMNENVKFDMSESLPFFSPSRSAARMKKNL